MPFIATINKAFYRANIQQKILQHFRWACASAALQMRAIIIRTRGYKYSQDFVWFRHKMRKFSAVWMFLENQHDIATNFLVDILQPTVHSTKDLRYKDDTLNSNNIPQEWTISGIVALPAASCLLF